MFNWLRRWLYAYPVNHRYNNITNCVMIKLVGIKEGQLVDLADPKAEVFYLIKGRINYGAEEFYLISNLEADWVSIFIGPGLKLREIQTSSKDRENIRDAIIYGTSEMLKRITQT